MNNNNIDSKIERHPELNFLNQELELVDLAVSNRAKPYGYIEAGEALSKVQKDSLFKYKYNSFDEFCLDRYNFLGEQGLKLIRASEVAQILKDKGFTRLPKYESHARNLTKFINYDQQNIIAAIWLELTSSNKGISVRGTKRIADKYSKSSNSSSYPSTFVDSASTPLDSHKELNSLDFQGQLEIFNNLENPCTPLQPNESTPHLHKLDESQLIVIEQLKELTNKLSFAINNFLQITETSSADKDLKIEYLINQVKNLEQALANKDLTIQQWINHANTIEEQKKSDFNEYQKTISLIISQLKNA
jgi:hypothetical protein